MRNELEEIQLTEHYLQGKLSDKHKSLFEAKMQSDPDFKASVEKQQLVLDGIEQVALKQDIQTAGSKFKKFNILKKVGLTVAVIAVVAAGVFVITKMTQVNSIDSNLLNSSKNIKYALNETGDTLWSDADANLESEFFDIDHTKDTVLIGKSGMVIAIPVGAFIDDDGNEVENVEVELKEAINPEDILTAGLSTFSGDRLLETGGMFYLNARSNGQNLKVNPNKEIVADIPTSEVKPGMQLFEGKRKLNGQIDWVNPKPIEQFLTTVDINSLNFYPEIYEPKLDQLGHDEKSKKWKDSLYYSFGGDESLGVKSEMPFSEMKQIYLDTIINTDVAVSEPIEEFPSGIPNFNQINPSKIQAIWNDKFNNSLLATKEFEERLKYIHQTCDDEILEL
jgi:hypothetical protein